MKVLRISMILLVASFAAIAQSQTRLLMAGDGAPSGACTSAGYVNLLTGAVYNCVAGNYSEVPVPAYIVSVTVSALPAASSSNKQIFIATDAQSANSCASGGSTHRVLCRSNGSTWEALGGAGGGGTAWGDVTGTLSSQTDLQSALDAKTTANGAITGATKTKVTYDTKGLITSGADATTFDIADSSNKRYVTDAQLTVIGNTSGTNTGDQTTVSGNAGSATILQNTRTINGVNFNGSANITVPIHTYVFFATTTAPACSNGGGTTTFLGPSGAGSATETSVVRYVVPLAGTVKNLRVWLGGNVPASETAAAKVVLGGSAQANPTCSIAAGAAVCNDTSGSFAVVAGDTLNVQINCSGGTTALNARASVSFTIQQ